MSAAMDAPADVETGRRRRFDVSVRRDELAADYSVEVAHPDVTVADVLVSLKLPPDALIDGGFVDDPDHARAVDVLSDGVELSDPDVMVRASPAPASVGPVVEVSVVAGFDAGSVVELAAGMYRIGCNPSNANGGWVMQVDLPSQERSQARHDARPWHDHGQTVEVVMGPASAIAINRPIEPETRATPARHRPLRRAVTQEVAAIEPVDVPAPIPEPSPLSWATLLAPIPIALMMALLFRPIFALFAAMGPVMAFGRWVESRRRYRKDCAARDRTIEILTAQTELAVRAQAELIALLRWQAHPHVADLWRRAREQSVWLWERRRDAPGFLTVAVGVGPDQVAPCSAGGATFDPQVHASLADPVQLRPVPHLVDLHENTGLGVHGDRDHGLAVMRSVVMQLATQHGPADLKIAIVSSAARSADWDWLKWLPHVDRSQVTARSATLANQLARIGSTTTTLAQPEPPTPVHLVIVDHDDPDVAAIQRAAVSNDIEARFLVVASNETLLPAACSAVVSVSSNRVATSSPERMGRDSISCPIGISETTAAAWARSLAPLVDPEVLDVSHIAANAVSLIDLLGFESSAELMVRWSRAVPEILPSVPLGVSTEGVFGVNLGTDGPHALVAGTTGSGKSEFLRTLVVSLAVQCPPEHLNFVLIDFKGGGAFDAVDQLPHVAGLITDLDETMVERAISSLRAELVRRETVFRDHAVSNFDHAVAQVNEPLARLVVIIDEFAALATSYADQLAAIIDLAARGRSLGMHLILATQRPSGVVDQKIRANTNLRVALRVQDAFDSQDIIGSGAAASIDRRAPGQAYVSIAGEEPVKIQTAFSGALDRRDRCVVRPLALFQGANTQTGSQPEVAAGRTELDVLIEAVVAASAQRNGDARPLWADPLPTVLDWIDLAARELAEPKSSDRRGVVLGLEDVPELQQQRPWRWDPDSGPLVMYAASAVCAGKAMVSLGGALAAGGAHLYVIDGDARRTEPLRDLAATGAFIGLGEADRIERTITFFETTLAARRVISTIETEPRLVLMIDNLAAVMGSFDDNTAYGLVERLSALARDGAPQRLHLAVTARTVRDVGHRLSQQFPNRLVLALADMGAYLTLGLRAREIPLLPDMRALDMATRRQVQLVEPPDPEMAESTAAHQVSVGAAPARIGSFPTTCGPGDLDPPTLHDGVLRIPVGIQAETLGIAALSLRPGDHALVIASGGMGRSTVLRLMAEQVSKHLQINVVSANAATSAADLAPALAPNLSPKLEPTLVVVDDADRLDESAAALVADCLQSRPANLWIVAGTTPAHARSLRSWVAPIRTGGIGAILGGPLADGDLLGVRLGRVDGLGQLPGRGHLVSRGRVWPTQFAATGA